LAAEAGLGNGETRQTTGAPRTMAAAVGRARSRTNVGIFYSANPRLVRRSHLIIELFGFLDSGTKVASRFRNVNRGARLCSYGKKNDWREICTEADDTAARGLGSANQD